MAFGTFVIIDELYVGQVIVSRGPSPSETATAPDRTGKRRDLTHLSPTFHPPAAGSSDRLRNGVLTVTYDGAGRVAGTTRPDLTTEAFTPYQVRGLGTSTSSASPGAATLLAEAVARHTDSRGYSAELRPDWRCMGLTNQTTDPEGYVGTGYRDANGLATVALDRSTGAHGSPTTARGTSSR